MLKSKISVFLVLVFLFSNILSLTAKSSSRNRNVDDTKSATLVVDAHSGRILHQKNADRARYPASLTKLMSAYLVFESLKNRRVHFDQMLPITYNAEAAAPRKLGLKSGSKIPLRDALLGMIIYSANDAAVVIAEAIAGSEERFANMMTIRARQLGMSDTVFRNASGLPDPKQKTTAYDLAKLGIALRRDFPEYYHLFSRTSFAYNGKIYNGPNKVTKNYHGADGLKTGYTVASGYNLVTSAQRGSTRLIGVVLGENSWKQRDNKMMSLLNMVFQQKDHANTNKIIPKQNRTSFKHNYYTGGKIRHSSATARLGNKRG